jgi:hypothetical protein
MGAVAAAAVMLVAIVAEDQTPLRAAPRADASVQAQLWEGDWLEVRGESAEYLKVWDHRRERPGFVRRERARLYRLDAESSGELRSVVRFLRDSAGHESLGIAHAALFLRAAPAGAYADLQGDLGLMADRLARRVSRGGNAADAAHLDVVKSYGVGFVTLEGEGRARTCYDGDSLRRALGAVEVSGRVQVEAALALTRGDCADPNTVPSAIAQWQSWRLEVLDRIEKIDVAPHLRARVRLRRVEALAYLAWQTHRGGDEAEGRRLASSAIRQLALVDRNTLADEDRNAHDRAVLQAAAVRWAASQTNPAPTSSKGGLRMVVKPGQPGESCLQLFGKAEAPLLERCTYGRIWPSSFMTSARGDRATIAVQPLPGWSELWVLRQAREGWSSDILTPAVAQPELGYVESAGFSPDGERLLVVREARVDSGRFERRFQVLRFSASDLKVELQASTPSVIKAFRRWAAPSWRGETLALRGESL